MSNEKEHKRKQNHMAKVKIFTGYNYFLYNTAKVRLIQEAWTRVFIGQM